MADTLLLKAGGRRFRATALAMLSVNAIICLFGLPWLARFLAPASLSGWQADFAYLDPTNGWSYQDSFPLYRAT